jgi:AcrR family transcriptional regulator
VVTTAGHPPASLDPDRVIMGAATGPAAPQHRRINPVTESSDWRSRRWEATHQRIYDTALALFQEHGFERVNVGQIAAGAGVSVPTFYAHYPSKEHVIMQLPTAHDFAALLAGQPAELALHERIRDAVPLWLSTWTADFREDALARWRIIAATPYLRTRAAEFERTSGGVVADALATTQGGVLRPAEAIVVNAYMSAYTAALLAWADCNGQHKLEELLDDAFEALQQR